MALDFGYAMARRWRRVVVCTVLGAGVAGAGAWLAGAHYTAEARLEVFAPGGEADHGAAARDKAEALRDPAAMRGLAPELRGVAPRVPAWRQAVHAALQRWGVEGRQDFAASLSRALSVEAAPDTNIVVLRFTWKNPGFAARALNALLHDQQVLASGHEEASQGFVLAQARVRDAAAALRKLEAQIAALPAAGGVAADAGAIEREKDRVTSRIGQARGSIDALKVDRDLLAKKLDAADKAYAGGGWVDNPDAPAGGGAMDPAFMDLLDKRGKLTARPSPDAAKLAALDHQIADAREHAYQGVHATLASRIGAIDTQLAAETAGMQADEQALRGLDDRLVQIEALQTSRDVAEGQEAASERAMDEARRQAEMAMREAAGLHVLAEASAPDSPDFPSPVFLGGVGAVLGLGLGAAWALRAERRRITIDRVQDIARVLRLPVLACVPELR